MWAALSHDSFTEITPLTSKQAKESAAYVNLRRWYDHIHHVVPGADAFPLIELALPAFVPPAPVAAPAPAAGKKEAGKKEAAKKEAAPAKDGKKAEKTEAVPEDKPAEKPKKEKKEKKAEAAPSGGSDEPTVDFLDLRCAMDGIKLWFSGDGNSNI